MSRRTLLPISIFSIYDETNFIVAHLNPRDDNEFNLGTTVSFHDSIETDTLQTPVHIGKDYLEDIDPSSVLTQMHLLIDFEFV